MRTMTFAALATAIFVTGVAHAEMIQTQPLIDPVSQSMLSADVLGGTGPTSTLMLTSAGNAGAVKPLGTAQDESGMLDRLTTVASNTVRQFTQSGVASWYGRQFHGRKTASGEIFNANNLTAAHRTLPLSCYIRVTNQDNGKSVVVKVNDRGPFHAGRILDLSYAAAKQIGIVDMGKGNVTIERISGAK